MAVGRISGPLLKDNLLRNGVNLAFETNLLYLDVVNSRVGINTATPGYDLDVNGTTRTTNLYASTSSTIGTFTITGSTISSTNSTINLTPSGSNAVIYQAIADIGNISITTNTISSTNTNGAINITANGTGAINLNSNVLVTGNLHATGNITADGNITLGASSSDTITFDAEVNSNIIPSANNTYNLGSSSLAWNNLYSNNASVTNITSTNISNSGTLGVTGASTLSGNTTIGASSANTLTVTASINSNLIPSTTNTYTLGSNSLYWNNGYISTINTAGMQITSNSITATGTNSNLQLSANGTGTVYIPTSNLTVTNNAIISGTLGVTGTTTLTSVGITGTLTQTGDFTQTGNFTTSGNVTVNGNLSVSGEWTIGNIIISPPGNPSTITTSTTNSNLILTGNGTGSVIIEGLSVNSNVISSTGTNANISLTPQGTGNVVINNNQSLIIPVGTTAQQPSSPSNGMIRYNTDHNRYEGYANGYWTNLGGVQSVDGNTYITPESSPGAGNNVISFYAGGVNTAYIDTTKLYATNFQTSELSITGNTISALSSNTNINFVTSGTGGVQIGNLVFNGNSITNISSNAITTFTETSSDNSTFVGTISTSPVSTFVGNISGTTLTVTSPPANPFGGSISFNGTSEYLSMSPGFGMGGVAYTFECFFYTTTSAGTQTLLGGVVGGYSVSLIENTGVQVTYVGGASTTYSVSFSENTWNHLVVVRSSGLEETVFINGTRSSSGVLSNTTLYGSNSTTIGASSDGSNLFAGNITNMRVVVGTAEYDPTMSSLVVPTGPLTSVTGTRILLLAMNSVNYLNDNSENETISQGGTDNISYSNLSPYGSAGMGLAVGQVISGTGITSGTYIVSNISGTGTSSTSSWTINIDYASAITSETITSTPVILNVSSVVSGAVSIGNTISGTGVSSGTIITAQISGTTNGVGTYYVTPVQTVSNSTTLTEVTGSGYVQFAGSYGVVIPVGNTTNYPALQYVQTGMMRFNNDPNYMYVEIYNGTSWTSVAGEASGVTTSQATDIAIETILTFG
jgi:Concanavalin A-like lectin/glucanases superfamily